MLIITMRVPEALILSLLVGVGHCELTLRYNAKSCGNLEPVYVNENWQLPGGQVSDNTQQSTTSPGRPRLSRDRSPPFKIELEMQDYRRSRLYTIQLMSLPGFYFDAFLIQARGSVTLQGNVTLVGTFEELPTIAKYETCFGKEMASAKDRALPVQMSNLTFHWRAPHTDFGPIKFIASIVVGEEYNLLESTEIKFNPFPVPAMKCGRDMSCFRQCCLYCSSACTPEEANYMLVMRYDRTKEDVVFHLGGVLDTDEKYIAVGFGEDYYYYTNIDVVACFRDGDKVYLGHYLMENPDTTPYLHRSYIAMDNFDIDKRTNFTWCQFKRKIRPESMWDLDLSRNFYQFYFFGDRNDSIINQPDWYRHAWQSYDMMNITDITNEIVFSSGVLGLEGGPLFIIISLALSLPAIFSF